jgi:hypothetical protein
MRLFHGSTVIVEHPRIIESERGRDFGAGFYTTDIREQAVRWAQRKARIEAQKGVPTKAIVSIYEFDTSDYDNLRVAHFPEPSAEWLDMVCKCRSDLQYRHGFDVVTGKIANDTVGATISYVVQGVMRREDALERLKFEKINNQLCFATGKALSYLTYIGFEEVRWRKV